MLVVLRRIVVVEHLVASQRAPVLAVGQRAPLDQYLAAGQLLFHYDVIGSDDRPRAFGFGVDHRAPVPWRYGEGAEPYFVIGELLEFLKSWGKMRC